MKWANYKVSLVLDGRTYEITIRGTHRSYVEYKAKQLHPTATDIKIIGKEG
jgi:hypothetical protein